MELRDIKEKLDFMKKYGIDSIKFRESIGVDSIEFELCYFIDYPEESLSLWEGENKLIHTWDRSLFEERIKEYKHYCL